MRSLPKLQALGVRLNPACRAELEQLAVPLQRAMDELLAYLLDSKGCALGDQRNLAVYTPKRSLAFYINLAGIIWNKPVAEYLAGRGDLNFRLAGAEGPRRPRKTVFFGRRIWFVRDLAFDPDDSDRYFGGLLRLLDLPPYLDAAELEADEVQALAGRL